MPLLPPLMQLIISTHAPLRGATVASGYTLKATDISTHAPLRGATTTALPTPCSQTISTHAPLRGATCWARSLPPRHRNFYSRASARRDRYI